MFHPTTCLIENFVRRLQQAYHRMYSRLEPDYPEFIGWAGRLVLEHIATSDALYHNVEHTVLVTLVGQDILRGKHLREGSVTPRDWLHMVLALLCHDIGYVRGVCQADRPGVYTTGRAGQTVILRPGATDAALTPYHVDRGQCFVRQHFGGHAMLDVEAIAAMIERTRFPVPADAGHQGTADYPGLVRAADLLGQLGDPHYLRKLPALFYELVETGSSTALGYTTPDDLRLAYPRFFWQVVHRYIQDGLRYLLVTQDGKQWVANLYAHVFTMEHHQSLDVEPVTETARSVAA